MLYSEAISRFERIYNLAKAPYGSAKRQKMDLFYKSLITETVETELSDNQVVQLLNFEIDAFAASEKKEEIQFFKNSLTRLETELKSTKPSSYNKILDSVLYGLTTANHCDLTLVEEVLAKMTEIKTIPSCNDIAAHGTPKLAELFLKYFRAESKGEENPFLKEKSIFFAVSNGNIDMYRYLRKMGAIASSISRWRTLLHELSLATCSKKIILEILKDITSANPSLTDMTNSIGFTPLATAFIHGNYFLARQLISGENCAYATFYPLNGCAMTDVLEHQFISPSDAVQAAALLLTFSNKRPFPERLKPACVVKVTDIIKQHVDDASRSDLHRYPIGGFSLDPFWRLVPFEKWDADVCMTLVNVLNSMAKQYAGNIRIQEDARLMSHALHARIYEILSEQFQVSTTSDAKMSLLKDLLFHATLSERPSLIPQIIKTMMAHFSPLIFFKIATETLYRVALYQTRSAEGQQGHHLLLMYANLTPKLCKLFPQETTIELAMRDKRMPIDNDLLKKTESHLLFLSDTSNSHSRTLQVKKYLSAYHQQQKSDKVDAKESSDLVNVWQCFKSNYVSHPYASAKFIEIFCELIAELQDNALNGIHIILSAIKLAARDNKSESFSAPLLSLLSLSPKTKDIKQGFLSKQGEIAQKLPFELEKFSQFLEINPAEKNLFDQVLKKKLNRPIKLKMWSEPLTQINDDKSIVQLKAHR